MYAASLFSPAHPVDEKKNPTHLRLRQHSIWQCKQQIRLYFLVFHTMYGIYSSKTFDGLKETVAHILPTLAKPTYFI